MEEHTCGLLAHTVNLPSTCLFLLLSAFAGVPDHWCSVTDAVFSNCSESQVKSLTLPVESSQGGEAVFSRCERFQYNYTRDQIQEFCSSENSSGVADTSDLKHVSCDQWSYDTTFFRDNVVTEVRLFRGSRKATFFVPFLHLSKWNHLMESPVFHSSNACLENSRSFNCHQTVFDQPQQTGGSVLQWDLVCDKAGLASTVAAVFMLGRIVSSYLGAQIADR